jgi:acetyl-CoA carboxylase biotin carboxylase subunit
MADAYGGVVHLGERECSVQRRHQKLIEESPSPVIDGATRAELGAKICAALARVGYRNAGTVEFFRDPEGRLYFMEMNARLQVEHPVTEMISGRDLVAEQIRLAANEPLSFRQEEVRLRGHAFECRINAEDPAQDFRPNPGLIEAFRPPEGAIFFELPSADGDGGDAPSAWTRLDTHVRDGYRIPPHYDSLLAKVIVHGGTRDDARLRMISALQSLRVEGVRTTVPVHLEILRHPSFAAGDYDTGFVGRLLG